MYLKSGAAASVIEDVKTAFSRNKEKLNNSLHFLSAKYEQDKYFDAHLLAVKPETVSLGSRYETRRGNDHLVYDTFHYMLQWKQRFALCYAKSNMLGCY
jgi:hypothetical protein